MKNSNGIVFGAICEREVVFHNLALGDWDFQNFFISPDRLSFTHIPDSAFSSPARYIQEIFLRVSESKVKIDERLCFIFNPLFAATRTSILRTVATLRSRKELPGPAVVSDRDGFPVGYLLPSTFDTNDARYLALLSTVDSALDAALLELLCFSSAPVIQVPRLHLSEYGCNGFDDHGMVPLYKWIAQRAISELQTITSSDSRNVNLTLLKQKRDAIPFCAIMPKHAGDVLFFALAFNQVISPYRYIAVNRTYVDIVQDVAPLLDTISIDSLSINSDSALASGKSISDNEYFKTYKDFLPKRSFYTYCRPSRNYNTTNFHLIDHFAFSLGYSPRNEGELLINTRSLPVRLTPPLAPNAPARILLHFDAGWPLKVYPKTMQSELIELLLSRGHEVTVLAPLGYFHRGVKSTTFTSLSNFVALAKAHNLLVGMDSFPSHYGVHVLGLPTLCLFASTKPVNSNALPSGNYSFMERGLSCRPCRAIVCCPAYGGSECQNFVTPISVADRIEDLLIGTVPGPGPGLGAKCAARTEIESLQKTVYIQIQFVALQVWIINFIALTSYLATLVRELLNALRREGLLAALRRTVRFVARKFRALS